MLFVFVVSRSANGLCLPQELETWTVHAPPLPVSFYFIFVESKRISEISPSLHSPAPFAFLLPSALITADEVACQ